jgi:hypothetical protein
MHRYLIISAALICGSAAFAAENDEATASFCKYVTEQATAQRDLLRTPSVVLGPTQPSLGTAAQLIAGLSNSLSDDRKAGLTTAYANKTCTLYGATTDAQQHLNYALPSIEKDVLNHRLQLIDDASKFLDSLIASNIKSIEAQNLTRPAVYALESAKQRLDTNRISTSLEITSAHVPTLSNEPLRNLVNAKLQAEDEAQEASIKLSKQTAWDVKLEAGAHRQVTQLNTTSSRLGPYGGFTLTYNLSRSAADRHFDNSRAAYLNWKRTQFDDVAQEAELMKQQIVATIKLQQDQLRVLEDRDQEIGKELSILEGVETSAALGYKNQLLADQAVLRVDLEDVKYRSVRLQEYLTDNF